MGWGLCTVAGVAGKGETLDVVPRLLITGRRVAAPRSAASRAATRCPQLVDRYLAGEIDVDPFISHRIDARRGQPRLRADGGPGRHPQRDRALSSAGAVGLRGRLGSCAAAGAGAPAIIVAASSLRVPVRTVCEHVFVRWEQPDDRGRGARGCPATAIRRSCAASTRPRRSTPASTRSARSPRSTACPSARGCRFAGRSTRTADAPMRAPTALLATRRSSWPTAAHKAHRRAARSATRSTGPSATARTGVTYDDQVLDHWSTIKPAYRVTLEDGTELIASGDHRFLTRPRLEARRPAPSSGPISAPI